MKVSRLVLVSILIAISVSDSVAAFPFQERHWKFPRIEYGKCDRAWASAQYNPQSRSITLCDRKMDHNYRRYVIQHEVSHFNQHRLNRPFSERDADFKAIESLYNLGDCSAIEAAGRRSLSRVRPEYRFGVQYARQRLRDCRRQWRQN